MNDPMRLFMTVKETQGDVWVSGVVSELRKHNIKTLISLVTEEIGRVGEAKEKYGCGDPGYFYHLIDIRNRLMVLPLDAEPPPHLSDKALEKLFGGRGVG